MTLVEFFKDSRFVSHYSYDFTMGAIDMNFPDQRVRMVLKDGEQMSVQASEYHYCYPRRNISLEEMNNFGDRYYEYEIGFPSFIDATLLQFAEQPDAPKDTVYAYVDIDIVQQVIDSHGGIDEQATLDRWNNQEKK